MKSTFVEMPAFARLRPRYLDDDGFSRLQAMLMQNPEAGDVMQGAGGLRKMRFADGRRRKGTRGGLRVLYFFWEIGAQFWMFMIYDKGEVADMTGAECTVFRDKIKAELIGRSS
jgi:hypothetical protein